MPSIHVHLFEGRTVEQKRAYAAALTEATVRVLGGSPEAVDVVFTDVARHDWATGGRLWSDRQAASPTASAAASMSPTAAATSAPETAAPKPSGDPPVAVTSPS